MDKFLEVATPALVGLLYVLAARYAVLLVGMVLERVLVGIHELQRKINENKYLQLVQVDDLLLGKLEQAVLATKGELVDRLKAAGADGKLTEDEAKAAARAAYATFIKSLGRVEYDELVSVFGDDLKRIAMAKIPYVVELLKRNSKSGEAAADPE